MDYKEDDFCVERRKVRAHLLGCKVLAQSTARFSPVVISKLHRVITEPHLEVACTMEDIRGELGMTPDQFNEFLDCENLATLDKLCDILNKLSTDTGIDIQFFTLNFNQNIDNDQSSPIVSEAQEIVPEESPIVSSDSNVNENENLLSEKLGHSVHNLKINNQSFPIDNETQEIGPEPSNNISSVPDTNINDSTSSTVVSRGDTSDLKDRTSDSSDMTESSPDININESTSSTVVSRGDTSDSSDMTESSPETKQASVPLIFVMCKVLICPPMHFLGKSSSYEESKRRAAILFLKHVNSLKTDHLRKRHFIENFSSGDEAEC